MRRRAVLGVGVLAVLSSALVTAPVTAQDSTRSDSDRQVTIWLGEDAGVGDDCPLAELPCRWVGVDLSGVTAGRYEIVCYWSASREGARNRLGSFTMRVSGGTIGRLCLYNVRPGRYVSVTVDGVESNTVLFAETVTQPPPPPTRGSDAPGPTMISTTVAKYSDFFGGDAGGENPDWVRVAFFADPGSSPILRWEYFWEDAGFSSDVKAQEGYVGWFFSRHNAQVWVARACNEHGCGPWGRSTDPQSGSGVPGQTMVHTTVGTFRDIYDTSAVYDPNSGVENPYGVQVVFFADPGSSPILRWEYTDGAMVAPIALPGEGANREFFAVTSEPDDYFVEARACNEHGCGPWGRSTTIANASSPTTSTTGGLTGGSRVELSLGANHSGAGDCPYSQLPCRWVNVTLRDFPADTYRVRCMWLHSESGEERVSTSKTIEHVGGASATLNNVCHFNVRVGRAVHVTVDDVRSNTVRFTGDPVGSSSPPPTPQPDSAVPPVSGDEEKPPGEIRYLRLTETGRGADRHLVLSWFAPIDDGGARITNYDLDISRPGRSWGGGVFTTELVTSTCNHEGGWTETAEYNLRAISTLGRQSGVEARYCLRVFFPHYHTTYSVSVRAENRAGRGPASRVRLVTEPLPITWWSAGDSYSSGEGIGDEGIKAFNNCQQSRNAYGPSAAQILKNENWSISVQFTACTGAIAENLFGVKQVVHEGRNMETQADQVVGERFDIITLSFGGNDIGFSSVLECAIRKNKCPEGFRYYVVPPRPVSESELTERIDRLLDPVPCSFEDSESRISSDSEAKKRYDCDLAMGNERGSIIDVYQRLVNQYLTPRGRVYVIGYPQLFAPTSEWRGEQRSLTCHGISSGYSRILANAADYFTEKLKEAVDRTNGRLGVKQVHFVDVQRLYRRGGHELCGGGEDWLNGIEVGKFRLEFNKEGDSFHPNRLAHDAIARELVATIRRTFDRHTLGTDYPADYPEFFEPEFFGEAPKVVRTVTIG